MPGVRVLVIQFVPFMRWVNTAEFNAFFITALQI
jgi:hypothetical protein